MNSLLRRRVSKTGFALALVLAIGVLSSVVILDRNSQIKSGAINLSAEPAALSESSILRILNLSNLITNSNQAKGKFWVDLDEKDVSTVYLIDSRDGFWYVYTPLINQQDFRVFLTDVNKMRILASGFDQSKSEYSGVEILVRDEDGFVYRWADLHLVGAERISIIQELHSLIQDTEFELLSSLKIGEPR